MLDQLFNSKTNAFIHIKRAFPKELETELDVVIAKIKPIFKTLACSEPFETYFLASDVVVIPYRCYYKPISNRVFNQFTVLEKKIYACISLLNYDGFIREMYLHYLLEQPLDEWMLPFFMKVSGEYVKEILEILYKSRKNEDNTLFKEFSKKNPKQSQRNYSRMTSYWNEYYRFDITHPCMIDGRQGIRTDIRDYVGYSLFHECWGISPCGTVKLT